MAFLRMCCHFNDENKQHVIRKAIWQPSSLLVIRKDRSGDRDGICSRLDPKAQSSLCSTMN